MKRFSHVVHRLVSRTQRRWSGNLSISELESAVEQGEIETVIMAMTDMYGRQLGKRLDAHFFLETALQGGTHCCDYLFACDMDMNPIPGYRWANWERGYGDVHLMPDLSSLSRAAWLPSSNSAWVQCHVLDNTSHEPVPLAPRSLLARQLERLEQSTGLHARAATELEFYIYDSSYEDAAAQGYSKQALRPLGPHVQDYHLLSTAREEPFIAQARRLLQESGVPVENSKGEAGAGQHELNVKYTDPLGMADRHVLYKQLLKEVAQQHGHSVSFMAKPFAESTGSGCHIHLSLHDQQGNNVFRDDDREWEGLNCSKQFQWFLGGWIEHTPALMPFLAPTINAYKRFQAGSWAPTRLAWSYDNRTAGFRVVGSGKSLRVENRIAGADVNPYLVLACGIAAGLDGIEQKIEPPPCFRGNIYEAAQIAQVPKSLHEAVRLLEGSEFAKRAFGEEVVEHYVHFYRTEQQQFDKFVTDWERSRYFEMI